MVQFIIFLILGILLLIFGINFSIGLHQADSREIDRHSVIGLLFLPFVGPKKIAQMGEVKNARIYRQYFSTRGKVLTYVKWTLLITLLVITASHQFISSSVNASRQKKAEKLVQDVLTVSKKYFDENASTVDGNGSITLKIKGRDYLVYDATTQSFYFDEDGNVHQNPYYKVDGTKLGESNILVSQTGYSLFKKDAFDDEGNAIIQCEVRNATGSTVISNSGTISSTYFDSTNVGTLIAMGYMKDNKAFLRSKVASIKNNAGTVYADSISINGFQVTYDSQTGEYSSSINVDTTILFTGFSIFFLLAFLFVEQSITVTIAEKKNLLTIPAAFIGLIPFVGVVIYILHPGKKRIMVETVNKTYNFKEILSRSVIYFEMLVLCFIVLVPVVYLVGSAFTDSSAIPSTIWPEAGKFSTKNLEILFKQQNREGQSLVDIIEDGVVVGQKNAGNRAWFLYWFKNTFFVALLSMIFSVLFITGTAYVFARFKFRGKKGLLLSMLILQMFPSFMSLVATYQLLKILNMLNNPYALIFIYTSGAIPYNVWLIKGFLQNIPKDLDESATIDGANKLQIFFKIILPLSLPIITFVAVSQFMGPWMDYILPSYILKNPSGADGTGTQSWTMAVGLYSFIGSQGDKTYRPTLFAMGSLIIAVPITILYVVFQRYLIEGITAGASKG